MKYKIGDKVYPFRKTAVGFNTLEDSHNWRKAKEINQKYLYIVDVRPFYYILNYKMNKDRSGDHFKESDFRSYLAKLKLKKLLED